MGEKFVRSNKFEKHKIEYFIFLGFFLSLYYGIVNCESSNGI